MTNSLRRRVTPVTFCSCPLWAESCSKHAPKTWGTTERHLQLFKIYSKCQQIANTGDILWHLQYVTVWKSLSVRQGFSSVEGPDNDSSHPLGCILSSASTPHCQGSDLTYKYSLFHLPCQFTADQTSIKRTSFCWSFHLSSKLTDHDTVLYRWT